MNLEAKVGIFVIIGIAILAYMSMKVGKFDFGKESGYTVTVPFQTASGLAKDVQVEIAGVQVGRVKSISLEDGKALVDLMIYPDIKLTKDVKAAIRTRGMLGDKYVELIQGSFSAPEVKPGDRISRTISSTDMDALMDTLGEVAQDIKKITGSLANVIGGEQGEASLRAIVDNIRDMAITLNNTVQDNNEDLSRLISNLSDFSERLKDMGDANTGDIREIVKNIREASGKLENLLTGLGEITTKINNGEGSIGKLVNKGDTVESLNEALASLGNIADKIDKGQGSIGKLVNEDDTVENINAALSGINNYLSKQDTYRTYIDYTGEYLVDSDEVKSYVTLKIQPKEDKYYLLQIVDDPKGKQASTETEKTVNGVKTNEKEIETDFNALKFSVQIAKRYFDLGIRGGLTESTGGVGVDYYLFNDMLTLSLDAFDFGKEDNAHLKLTADFRPYNHIYISSGLDDFISDDGEDSFFIGAGIDFSDEDIKTLLSNIPIPTK